MNPTRLSVHTLLCAAVLSALSCAQAGPHDVPAEPAPLASSASPAGAASPSGASLAFATPAAPTPGAMPDESDDEIPDAPFTGGAASFAKVKETLLQSYFAEGLTEDDLYRAATAGMLQKLDPKMKRWNKLLGPRELAEIKNDLKGEVVGIGVQIKFDAESGYADVLAPIPGSPADKAGLVPGDKIVTVNGRLYKGMRLADVVADIRGKAGERVTLSVLRGDKLVSVTVERGRVAYDQAVASVLPGGVGYVKIPGFNEKTAAAVRDGLGELAREHVTSLVLDLRANPGGSFDAAIEAASAMLPEGAVIVTTKRRGKVEEKHLAAAGGVLTDLPMVVLVDGATGSGAEFVAGALAEDRHARIVGAHTKGKWSVQMLDDLPSGYAFKYTVSLFHTPAGRSYEGVGMPPDVEVAMDERALARSSIAKSPDERLAADVQLRTARELVLRGP